MPILKGNQLVVDIAIWAAVVLTVFTGAQYLVDGEQAAHQAHG